tara:strand:+ start:808 stop:1623 length:816 start_codon:yes stop_codon:yes gene_type:complete
MNKSKIICNNCGKMGHISAYCKEPITSYGIILFKKENDKFKLLMINKKDSLCYIDFIKGKYDINNVDYIQILIDKFSVEEKQNILINDYKTLWENLWLVKEIKNKKEYNDLETKFLKLKTGYYNHKLKKRINLNYFIEKSNTNYESSEWEFPKGKKERNEKNIDCAIRECCEETNYNVEDYDIIINIENFSELYRGENKVNYRHIYYLGILNNYKKLGEVKGRHQQMEVKEMKWLTKEECLEKLRDYHKTRVKIINNVYNLLNNLEDYIII